MLFLNCITEAGLNINAIRMDFIIVVFVCVPLTKKDFALKRYYVLYSECYC